MTNESCIVRDVADQIYWRSFTVIKKGSGGQARNAETWERRNSLAHNSPKCQREGGGRGRKIVTGMRKRGGGRMAGSSWSEEDEVNMLRTGLVTHTLIPYISHWILEPFVFSRATRGWFLSLLLETYRTATNSEKVKLRLKSLHCSHLPMIGNPQYLQTHTHTCPHTHFLTLFDSNSKQKPEQNVIPG